MFDVITMGSSTVDMFASADSELIEIKTKNSDEELIAYPLGSKIIMNEVRQDIGGNGTNAAVSFSHLGLKAGYLGKIGKDLNGGAIIEKLNKEGITFLGSRGKQSGFSIILNSELGKDRTILGYKGDNNNLKLDEIDFTKLKAKWYYLSSMLHDSFTTMEKIAKRVKQLGAKIAFNPSATISKNGIDFVKNILDVTDVLILNKEEATDLVGKGETIDLIKRLHNLGIKTVIITMGEEGLIGTDGKKLYAAKVTPNCKILETTGAGDAFASTFVAGLIMDKTFETAIKMGMLNAESVITHHGAQNKLLTWKEMQRVLPNDHREITQTDF